MSTSQSPTAAPVERSWHPVFGRSGLTKRRRRLLLLGAAIVGFLSLFVWLLRRPILEPQVYLVGLESPEEQFNSRWTVRSTQPTIYSQNAWSGLEELRDQLSAGRWPKGKAGSSLFLQTPPDAHQFQKQLQTVSESRSDVLILFLKTQAVNRDGKAMFGWNGSSEAENRWWDADQLLAALQDHPASLKLVMLDAGQTQWAPQQGILINGFLRVLKTQLHRTGDPSLWFLCSHSDGEISYLDHKHRNSLFNIAVLDGMRGAADLDGNGLISVREITQYTYWKVDFWSQRYAGYEFRQTPQILWGGGNLDIDSDWPNLIPVVEETANQPKQSPEKGSETKEGDSQNQTVASVLSSGFTRLVRHSVETLPSRIGGRLIPAGGMGLPGLVFLAQVPAETTAPPQESPNPNPPPSAPQPEAATDAAQQGVGLNASQPSGNDSQAEAAAPVAESDDSEDELNEYEKALQEAWKVRDRLLNSQEVSWTVANRFPLEFRRLEQELIRLEFLARNFGEDDRPGWKRQLARIVDRFQVMEAELKRRIPLPVDSDPVKRIVQEQPFHSLALSKMVPYDSDPGVLRIEQVLTKMLAAFEQEDRVSARQLADSLSQDRELIEVELACSLAELPVTVPGLFKKQALENRIRLEELAARAFGYQAWIQDRFRSTELSLSRSETLLLNHVPGTLGSEPRRLFDRIAFEIDGIESALTTVIETDRLTAEVLSRFDDYIRLSRLSRDAEAGLSPTPGELAEMIDLLSDATHHFSSPDPERIPQFGRILRRLRDKDRLIQRRIEESAEQLAQMPGEDATDLAWRREVLLRVSLIDGPQRLALWKTLESASVTELDTSEAELASLAGLIAPALSPGNVAMLNSHVGLQAQLAEMALTPAPPSETELESLKELSVFDPAWSDDVLLSTCMKFGLLLEDLYASTTDRMLELPLNLTALKAEHTSSKLRSWSTFSRLLSPAVTGRQFQLEPSALQYSAGLRELLTWQVARLQRHRSAYGTFYSMASISAERNYQHSLRMIWATIPEPEVVGPEIELTEPETLTLSQSELPELELVCKNKLAEKFRGVLVLEFDRSTLDASFSSPVGGSANIPADLNVIKSLLFPQEAEFLSLDLDPDSSKTIKIEMAWRDRQTRLSPIVVTLLGRYEQRQNESRATVLSQQTFSLQRRFSDSWLLSLREGIGTQRKLAGGSGLVLHPFPNRETEYAFQLNYLGDDPVRVDVELVEELSAGGSQTFLLGDRGLEFSASSSSAALNWSSSIVEDKPAGASQEESNPASKASRPIGRSLLLKVSDQNSGQVAFIPIQLQTQRPRRYLDASVTYDRNMELVLVNLKPRPGFPLPPGEIPIVCRLGEPGQDRPIESSATLSSANPDVDLRIPLRAKTDNQSLLSISADGIDREFLYNIPADRTVLNLPEWVDRSRLKIVSPRAGEPFALEGPPLKVNLEIDLPVEDLFLERDQAIADIWLDTIPKQQIDSTIDSDRMIRLELQEPDENGRVKIVAQVTDWEVRLSRAGLPEGECELFGTLHTSHGDVAANPVPIVFDGEPPALRAGAPGYVVQGAAFPVTLATATPDSSGISQIEAQVDFQGDGRFTPDESIYKGVRTEQEGRWRCNIPTSELTPGRYTVLIQARDAVGNLSEIISQPMNVVSTDQLQLLEAAQPVPVTGVVLYGKDPIPEAIVTLTQGTAGPAQAAGSEAESETTMTVKTDEAGRFRFENVPPGTWTLGASKLLLNRLRRFEEPVLVSPPPASAGILRVRLR